MHEVGAYSKLAACLLIVAVAIIAYLPAVDNFFISDDFVLLTVVRNLDTQPLYLLEMPSEIFRVMSYVYFWECFRMFGAMNAEPYYWAGIALHVMVSLLVCAVVFIISGRWLTAWAAGLFFAGYERHHEAVMWISAANDTILALNCLLFLLLWKLYLGQSIRRRARVLTLVPALIVFALALFSKEGAIALGPLAILSLVFNGSSWRAALRKGMPLLLMTIAYGCVWLSQAHHNFFVTGGFYALSPQFFPVYIRSLLRLLSPSLVFWIPLVLVSCQNKDEYFGEHKFDRVRQCVSKLVQDRSFLFFVWLLMLAVIPYSFLTYMNHIPSRNTYFPSVGLAGIVGALYTALHERAASSKGKRACIAFLLAVVSLNVTYIWIKKEPQFRARAAPTRQLIAMLNDSELDIRDHLPITVCGFPLDPWIGRETIGGFTRLKISDVLFEKACNESVANTLRWSDDSESYETNMRPLSAGVKE